MKKHIIITKLFDSGGSNSHFKTLVSYLGKENVILIVEDKEQLIHLENIISETLFKAKVLSRLHKYANLASAFTTNIKELYLIIKSIISILTLSMVNGFANVTISAVEPERHLYLLWIPFIKVTYILHSTPAKKYTWFTKFTCNFTLGKNTKIITVSNANMLLILENWSIVSKKKTFVSVIYNTIKKNIEEKQTQIFESDNRKYITTIGHVTDYKNPSIWLEVAKAVVSLKPDIEFLWIGGGPLLNSFQEASSKTDKIKFIGLVENPDYYLKRSIIYYQPSLNETHGIAVLEAMYNNLPCVVSNVGGLPESVKHHYNGVLVDPLNIQENVNALTYLLDNEDLRIKYGANSYTRFKDLFTYRNFESKMDDIYNRK